LFAGAGIRTGASDIILRPRLNRAFLDPFSSEPTLVVLCGHIGRDCLPLAESPDSIVRAAYHSLMKETGVDLYALGEVEFFLGKKPSDHDIYGADDRGYHASSPFVFGTELRRRALGILVEIGFPVKYGHSEVGYIEARDPDDLIWEQHEIELGLAPLPDAAEGIVICQWVLRNLAKRQGRRCLFDPIMRKGHAGSGLHVHLSPVVGGQHAAEPDAEGNLPDEAKWLIGGLVQLGGALMAFGNRSGGSFVRLSQAKEAPNAVVWGRYDRNALIRLPIVATAEDGREVSDPTIEFRLADGSAHPHLLLAGIAQAMLCGHDTKGIDELLARTASGAPEKESDVTPVPRSFDEVAAALDQYRSALERNGVFPAGMLDSLLDSLHT
jgi:glutamine synthetase